MLYWQASKAAAPMTSPQDKPLEEPRLVPTGSVDEVLFTGKRHGKNLSLFQSIGLVVFGLGVVFGIGLPLLVGEFHHSYFPIDLRAIFFGSVMCLAGVVWTIIGIIGATKAVRVRNRKRHRLQALR